MSTQKKASKRKPESFKKAMTDAGFQPRSAQTQNDFWNSLGITAIKMGSRTLKIEKKKP